MALLATALLVACGGGGGGSSSTVVIPPTLSSIAITPNTASIFPGQSQTFVAQGTYSDNTKSTLSIVNWTSSNTSILSINSVGVATANAEGTATVTAMSNGKSATATVTVKADPVTKIQITASTTGAQYIGTMTTMTVQATLMSTAISTLSNTAVTWTSSSPLVASVDTKGVVTALSAGNTSITAAYSGYTATYAFSTNSATVTTVTIKGLPAGWTAFPQGYKTPLTADATYSDGATRSNLRPAWSSTATSLISVSSEGIFETIGYSTGSPLSKAVITATLGGISNSTIGFPVIQKVAVPAITIGCTASGASSVSAATWNQNMATDPDNFTLWLVFDSSSCTRNIDRIAVFNTAVSPSTGKFKLIVDSKYNGTTGRYPADTYLSGRTSGPDMLAGDVLHVGPFNETTGFYTLTYAITVKP